MAAPSRLWAARVPLISVAFLLRLRQQAGIGAAARCAPLPPLSLRKNQLAADVGDRAARACALPFRRPVQPVGSSAGRASLSLASWRGAPGPPAPILAGSMKSSGLPLAGTMAKASATGLCATSEPRMLSSQAMESGSVRMTASSPVLAQRCLQLGDLLLGRLAGVACRVRATTAPCGGAGRSRPQTRSTGLLRERLELDALGLQRSSPAPRSGRRCAARDRSRRSLPASRCSSSQSLSLACGHLQDLEERACRPASAPARRSARRRTAPPPCGRRRQGLPSRRSPSAIEPLGRGRHVLALVLVGARHEHGVEPGARPSALRSACTRSAPLWRASGAS